MNDKVVSLPYARPSDTEELKTNDEILEEAKGRDYQFMLVVGEDMDGDVHIHSNDAGHSLIYLLEKAKMKLFIIGADDGLEQ